MRQQHFTEVDIQQCLQQSESELSAQTQRKLANARQVAIADKSHWFAEYKTMFSAGLVTALLLVTVALPLSYNNSDNGIPRGDVADENLELLMEDPEFFLWVSNAYSSTSF